MSNIVEPSDKRRRTILCSASFFIRSTLDVPTFNGAFYGFDADELLDTSKSASDRLIDTFSSGDEYLEIQIHGKENHSADIIEKVYFTRRAGDRAKNSGLIDKLNAKKIPYEIIE